MAPPPPPPPTTRRRGRDQASAGKPRREPDPEGPGRVTVSGVDRRDEYDTGMERRDGGSRGSRRLRMSGSSGMSVAAAAAAAEPSPAMFNVHNLPTSSTMASTTPTELDSSSSLLYATPINLGRPETSTTHSKNTSRVRTSTSNTPSLRRHGSAVRAAVGGAVAVTISPQLESEPASPALPPPPPPPLLTTISSPAYRMTSQPYPPLAKLTSSTSTSHPSSPSPPNPTSTTNPPPPPPPPRRPPPRPLSPVATTRGRNHICISIDDPTDEYELGHAEWQKFQRSCKLALYNRDKAQTPVTYTYLPGIHQLCIIQRLPFGLHYVPMMHEDCWDSLVSNGQIIVKEGELPPTCTFPDIVQGSLSSIITAPVVNHHTVTVNDKPSVGHSTTNAVKSPIDGSMSIGGKLVSRLPAPVPWGAPSSSSASAARGMGNSIDVMTPHADHLPPGTSSKHFAQPAILRAPGTPRWDRRDDDGYPIEDGTWIDPMSSSNHAIARSDDGEMVDVVDVGSTVMNSGSDGSITVSRTPGVMGPPLAPGPTPRSNVYSMVPPHALKRKAPKDIETGQHSRPRLSTATTSAASRMSGERLTTVRHPTPTGRFRREVSQDTVSTVRAPSVAPTISTIRDVSMVPSERSEATLPFHLSLDDAFHSTTNDGTDVLKGSSDMDDEDVESEGDIGGWVKGVGSGEKVEHDADFEAFKDEQLLQDLLMVRRDGDERKDVVSDSKPRYIAATPCDACVRNHDECHIRTGDRWILRCKTCNRTNRKKCSLEDQVRQEYYHLMKVQSSIFVDIYDDWVSREVKLGKMIASSNGGTGSHAVYYHFKSHQEIGSRLRKFARICQELCNLASKLDKLPRSQARFYSSLMERHDLMWEQDRQTPLSVAVLKSSEGGSTSSHAFNHSHDDEFGRGKTIARDSASDVDDDIEDRMERGVGDDG